MNETNETEKPENVETEAELTDKESKSDKTEDSEAEVLDLKKESTEDQEISVKKSGGDALEKERDDLEINSFILPQKKKIPKKGLREKRIT